VGHEYVNSHRALRQLGVRLADAGFPVLRFDYYGCGDSSGNTEDASVLQWSEDISAAILELRRLTGFFQVCMVGLRLGGALATLVAAERGDIESVALWDPVVDGRKYLDELKSLQKEMLRFRPRQRSNRKTDSFVEVLGCAFSRRLVAEIENINLNNVPRRFTKNLLVIQSGPRGSDGRVHDTFGPSVGQYDREFLDAPQIWLPTVDGSLLVPAQVLQTVVSWSRGIHP
jgi:pimeloyl-ACP methyl ester carboxylesterase